MKRLIIALPVLLLIISCARQPEIAQWGGPQRDGRYPGKDLLKQWTA